MKRKRLKLGKNYSTWNANRNNNVVQSGSGLSMVNCLFLPGADYCSCFYPFCSLSLLKEVKNCRNAMLLGLLHITPYVERENNFFSLVPRYYGHSIFPPRVSAITGVDSPPSKLLHIWKLWGYSRQWIIIGVSFKKTVFKCQCSTLK